MIRKVPKNISLILNETETIFLLELPSSIACKDSEEGQAALIDNDLYDYLTKGKGRYRKLNTIGVQTLPILKKTRHSEPIKYENKDNSTFASNWEMYDTYRENVKVEEHEESVSISEEDCVFVNDLHKLNDEISLDQLRRTPRDIEMQKLNKNANYFKAALVIERLLSNNCYNKEQKQFKGLVTDSLEKTVNYNYKLNLLWTFATRNTKSRCVTGICFNPVTEDIIAVGYGKYYFIDRVSTGVVMIWNIKNPKQPEREYYFKHSVTSLAFSSQHPNFLTVGFYNGHVLVVDVSKRDLDIIAEDCTAFEPAWDIVWLEKEPEFLVCFGDGRVFKYIMSERKFDGVQIMRVFKIEGKLKGINGLRLFEGNQSSSSRYASAKSLCLSSAQPSIFFVATNEGVLHKGSTDYCNQRKGKFKAHEGSVHSIKFSPHIENVFATCGDDFQKCIWLEGIDEPLVRSRFCLEPVLDIEWSPSHSTIIASLRGMEIYLWDLQRTIYYPQSKTRSPTNSRNTICRFTKCGRCLLTGDADGNVHIFSVSGLPFPAFFQKNLFVQSMKKMLVTNSQLTAKLENLLGSG